MADAHTPGWHNSSAPATTNLRPLSYDEMAHRLQEMEAMCRDIYVVAAELGLPQPLLNRLWVVAGYGSAPPAFTRDHEDAATQLTRPPMAPIREPEPPPLPPIQRRRTVLVVDDDALMLQVIERILMKENYLLLTANSGAEALELVAATPGVDLLITDVTMPNMTGPQLADRMRHQYPDLPVLFQTGFSEMLFDDRPDLGDRAAFLEKPFTPRGLMEAARLAMFDSIAPRE